MNLVTLECPLCRGMIQVDVSAAGQQVACPLCGGTMQVPPADALAAAVEPVPPPAETYSAPRQPPTSIFSSVPLELMPLACPSCGGMFQVPPSAAGLELPCPSCHKLVKIPEPTAAPAPTAPTYAALAPPAAAGAVDEVSTLLPPGTDSTSAAGVTFAPAATGATVVETLLPPGAAEASAVPGEQLALPQAPRPILVPPAGAPIGSMLVPTADGKVVALQERPKLLGEGEEQVEIRRLTPAEKARRRTVRNVILFILGLAGLVAIVIYMSRS